ncbi:hypothetical protein KJ781_04505 [Patescibacteria group bacterium]|nr:hypothetical protein [Patescibacteria group bacterium]
MVDRRLHAVEFTPVVQIGERVFLLAPVNKCFEVEWIENLPKLDKDFGAIGAGGSTGVAEVTEVYMREDELGQFRFVPTTAGVKVVGHWSPRGARMWGTDTATFELSDIVDYSDEPVKALQATEFFQHEDKKRFMQLYSSDAVSASLVRFYGYAFKLREIPAKEPYLRIPIQARAAAVG